MTKPKIKLLKGILLFAFFNLANNHIGGTDGIRLIKKQIEIYLSEWPDGLNLIISNIFGVAVSIIMLYCFVSGIYRIATFNLHIREYEGD